MQGKLNKNDSNRKKQVHKFMYWMNITLNLFRFIVVFFSSEASEAKKIIYFRSLRIIWTEHCLNIELCSMFICIAKCFASVSQQTNKERSSDKKFIEMN